MSGLQQFRLRVGPSVAVLTGLLAVIAAVTLVTNTPEWGPRTTTPQREWEFPDGPRAVAGMALIQNWKWQDVVILSGRWPMGFITAELEPNRVWNLREFTIEGPELTRFSRYVAGTIDRDRSLVAFDPRLDDARSINRIMRRMLGTDVTFVECGVFESRWTPTQVCSVRLEAAARLSRPGLR